MLSCKEVVERASALIDDDLSIWAALQMRFHLAMCKGCGAFIAQMRATARITEAAANTFPDESADDERMLDILSRVHKKTHSGS